MSNYPESMVSKMEYQEKTIANLKEAVRILESRLELNRIDMALINEYLSNHEDSRVWTWQNDGYDFLRSMANDLPVLIRADQLRYLLENGETIAED